MKNQKIIFLSKAILWDGNVVKEIIDLNKKFMNNEELEQYRTKLKYEKGCDVYFELKEYPNKFSETKPISWVYSGKLPESLMIVNFNVADYIEIKEKDWKWFYEMLERHKIISEKIKKLLKDWRMKKQ